MARVQEIEVVVAHNERATLRVGDVFRWPASLSGETRGSRASAAAARALSSAHSCGNGSSEVNAVSA